MADSAQPAPTAASTDPQALGVMQGVPPPAERTVRVSDTTSWRFPNTRWSFSHQRELGASAAIRRGPAPVAALPYALRDDLDAVAFTTQDGHAMTWGQAVDETFTDGLVVLHRGQVVYETYRGALQAHIPHLAMSVTKSIAGLLAAILVDEGALDPAALIPAYLPELAGTAFADATLRHVMDMTTGVRYREDYVDPDAEVRFYGVAAGFSPPPKGYAGPTTIFDFLKTLKKQGEHGEAFAYKTCNTEVLGWIVQRVAGKPFAELVSERIWQKIGAEEDGYVMVDSTGFALCGAGLNVTTRDLARFGEMLRLGGRCNGRQVVPEAVVADIAAGARTEDFAKAGYVTLPGWSYRNQWWVSHNRFGAYTARGIHGQVCYVAPGAEMVVARFASHPTAANGNGPLDRISIPSYEALAEHLLRG
ncbi:MAG: beta-lactamase family protein [Alphaproteobacteria bacterium]|nr:beta-lactamase family protein [Alphaproteobacteria bacterium]MBU1512923.1 beta-lactamase family protein [Alphaproteobacteria bacterium]MBU2096636.1 beta-lactamase family protein [Alphaproteobacteria bacterium]MBU2150519.1 beta-lactamase family protein [Alphaproteobacteria bacterium]MBU2306552.1 beta-lactamase family protein [Alphaproteobacteria bacterium]